ncbi:DUF6817 domain-containing protein [Streptomyces sp. NPDC001604]|uniref:DUF6817 domain-containing protein n=1 Tax=Streptomyces sp. NPDC001604 TaxID=3364593 RepID=UPI0036B4B5C4
MTPLCRATYGTDGFATTLLPLTERATPAALIGESAEELVYLYAGYERATVWPQIDGSPAVAFRDRFTGPRAPALPRRLQGVPRDHGRQRTRRTGTQRRTRRAARPRAVRLPHGLRSRRQVPSRLDRRAIRSSQGSSPSSW